jgi:hypothetical protein
VLSACSVFDPDDGTRSLSGNLGSYARGDVIIGASAYACLDDGSVHTSEWGSDCAVGTASSDYEGAFRIEGLEPEVYQLYIDSHDPWGDHARVVSLVEANQTVGFEIFPAPTAALETQGDVVISLPQAKLVVGGAGECGDGEMVIDLPPYEDVEAIEGDVDGCLEIENNDFLGTVNFNETFRPWLAGECGNEWCPDWDVVSRAPHRAGSLNASLAFEDQEVQVSGTWIE